MFNVPGIEVHPFLTLTLPPATTTNLVILGEKSFFVVDPGSFFDGEQQRLIQLIKQRLAQSAQFLGVILTHHHGDHVSGTERIITEFNTPIFAHAETAARTNFAITNLFREGDIFSTGSLEFEVLVTPGHAPGHVCLYEPHHQVLVAGDLVAENSTILIDPDEGHMGTYLNSLRRMMKLDLQWLIPAHGNPVADAKQLLEKTLNHRLQRLEELHAALPFGESDAVSPRELVECVYAGTVVPAMFDLAARSVLSSLIYLVEQRRAKRSPSGDKFFRAK